MSTLDVTNSTQSASIVSSTQVADKKAKSGNNVQNLFDSQIVINNVYQIAMSDGKAEFNKSERSALKIYYNEIKSRISESVANFVDNILYGNKNYTNEEWAQIIGNIDPKVASRVEESVCQLKKARNLIEYIQHFRKIDEE